MFVLVLKPFCTDGISKKFDTIKSGWSVLYMEGLRMIISKTYSIPFSEIIFILANSVDPDTMPPYAAFHLGLHCLPKKRSGVLSTILISHMSLGHDCFFRLEALSTPGRQLQLQLFQ